MRLTGIVVVFACSTLLGACTQKTENTSTNTDSIEAGRVIFEQSCAGCHPRSGRGDYLKRIPVTLLARRSEEELQTWIIGKDQHREMPSFQHLDTDQLKALTDYLKSQIGR